jgi:hypothetical protein
MNMLESDWYMLCWCAKWLGQDTIYHSALPDFDLYGEDAVDDRGVVYELWDLLDEADVVVAHNAVKFDIKKINTRFLIHDLSPPSPYRVVDTLRIARQHFAFMSNKLNDLGETLKIGNKQDTGGFQLWKDCLAGDPVAWKKMVSYCKQDIRLLENVYHTLLPYASGVPNHGTYAGGLICSRCGSDNIERRGYAYTPLSKFQRYACKDCGSWSRTRCRISVAPLSGA